MKSTFLLLTLCCLILFTGCKKDAAKDDFNISATTWKGTHVSAGETTRDNYIFNPGGSFAGTTSQNGLDLAHTGDWAKDGLKVSITFTRQNFSGTFLAQCEINSDHKKMTGTVTHSSGVASLGYSLNLTLQ